MEPINKQIETESVVVVDTGQIGRHIIVISGLHGGHTNLAHLLMSQRTILYPTHNSHNNVLLCRMQARLVHSMNYIVDCRELMAVMSI